MKRYAVFLATFLTMGLMLSGVAHADANDFTVTNFTADYYLNKADPQGKLTVQEYLTVDFADSNHGILRAIPKKYNGQDQHITITSVQRDGVTEPYTTYTSNGNEVLKIGNPNETINGPHTYTISYSAVNVIRFDSDRDQLIWNTNGTQWTQPFLAETATLHIADDVRAPFGSLGCFTGSQGSHEQDCTVDGQDKVATFTTTRSLQPGETMTFMTDFPAGTFQKPTVADWWRDHAAAIIGVALPVILAFTIAYAYWYTHGRDIKGRGTIVPEYAPPDNLKAAEADVIVNNVLEQKAISATIIDLAIRKYLKIIESTSDGVLGIGKHKVYTFQRLAVPAGDSLKPYEQQIYDGLFPTGDTTNLADLKKEFYKISTQVQKDIPRDLTAAGYFVKDPTKAGSWMHYIGFALLIMAFIVGLGSSNVYIALGAGVPGIIFIVFGFLMSKRTQKGVDAKDALEGLKLYMNVAEKDRMAMLQSADAPYAQKTDAPQQTVELFEKLLPYAMVMGVEKSWAKQFENIYTTPPDWYGGNWTAFNTGYLIGSLNDSMTAMNTSFAAPNSGGAGGGGGFAGGGGGGGGGGGW